MKERKAKEQLGVVKKRFCRFCREGGVNFDYKEVKRFEKFMSERGKILSRRFTGNCAKHQRKIAALIKRARFLALMVYTK
ncbi:MAG: 30S ribosomal protein S18 [Candidatus Omnitrophota bacterium]|nr:30S ribosomal protein S18 [Candidatus Omnitrophota bacterium]